MSVLMRCDGQREIFAEPTVSQNVLYNHCVYVVVLLAFTTHLRVLASSFLRFRDHTQ
jgi:hypothetical protein